MVPSPGEITVLLRQWDSDRTAVLEALTPIVYAELRKIAFSYLRRQRTDHTLQPTALVNEAWLRLVGHQSADFQDRAHFYAMSARVMRHVLVDAARAQSAAKRYGGLRIQFDEALGVADPARNCDLMAVHEALEKLHSHNPRIGHSVELRYFGGLELKEVAAAVGISLATTKRDLALGEAWLRRALSGAGTSSHQPRHSGERG